MDPIRFKLEDLDYIQEDYEDVFDEYKDYLDTEVQDGNSFVVANYRIVIPELHISLRVADWYILPEGADPNDYGAWEVQNSVYLRYEENEKDINKWISYCSMEITYALYGPCKQAGYPMEKIYELDCYIEFDEK